MEYQEKSLSPQESLRVIRETIDLAKRSFRDNGFHFLLWGWLVVIASVTHYYLAEIQHVPRPDMAWMVMVVVGVPVAFFYEWRRGKMEKTKNILHDWYGLIWLGFGISMMLTIPLAIRGGLSPIPFILVLVGFATFMSGVLLRFTPLFIGAAVMWAGALWCMFLSPSQHLLVQAGASILGYLVPGYLLNAQSRSRHV
ncbi:MAG TPA: hypothetical protein PK228_22530 [Saprospiraceae bacterium]|nr:hypothetical protein [Saprospiraceae bacterium]